MKIGIVCPYSFDQPGGVQQHILEFAQWLIDHGHEVQVLGPCGPDTPVPDFVVRGGSSIPVTFNGSVARLSFGPVVWNRVRKFIAQGKFDILHVHEPNSPSYSLGAMRVAQGPIVATYHAASDKSLVLSTMAPVLSLLQEKISISIAVSELAKRWHMTHFHSEPVVIPNGVNLAPFIDAREAAVRCHKSPLAGDDLAFGLDSCNRPLKICFLGRAVEPRKGLSVALHALERLREQGVAYEFIVMGSVPEDGQIPGFAGNVFDVPNVTWAGRVSDERKAEILSSSDIYVAPNTGGESFGIVLVEAMAAGATVVASDLEAFQRVLGIHPPEINATAAMQVEQVTGHTTIGADNLLDSDSDESLPNAGSGQAASDPDDGQALSDADDGRVLADSDNGDSLPDVDNAQACPASGTNKGASFDSLRNSGNDHGNTNGFPAGITFRNGDSDDLARVLIQLAQDPLQRNIYALRGIMRAQRFSWDVVGPQILGVYRVAADGRGVTLQ